MKPEAIQLKVKLELWRSWMGQKDPHSIAHQIYEMMWEDATFRVINECRRLAPTAPEGGARLNFVIHQLITTAYFRTQAMLIRRLCEKNKEKNPDWHVISLRRLLDDIEQNAHLYTRENIFAAAGLPYDYSEAKKRADEYESRESARCIAEGRAVCAFDPKIIGAWERPHQLHLDFDRLSGTTPSARDPSDALRKDLIQAVRAKLDVCKGVKTYVDKIVAHAAVPANRDGAVDLHINLERIQECHRAICSTASFVSVYVLREPHSHFLAVPQFNVLRYIEEPWVSPENKGKLQDVWDAQNRQVQEWGKPEWPKGWLEASP